MTPYEEGKKAFLEGARSNDNPYACNVNFKHSGLDGHWLSGYMCASDEYWDKVSSDEETTKKEVRKAVSTLRTRYSSD